MAALHCSLAAGRALAGCEILTPEEAELAQKAGCALRRSVVDVQALSRTLEDTSALL